MIHESPGNCPPAALSAPPNSNCLSKIRLRSATTRQVRRRNASAVVRKLLPPLRLRRDESAVAPWGVSDRTTRLAPSTLRYDAASGGVPPFTDNVTASLLFRKGTVWLLNRTKKSAGKGLSGCLKEKTERTRRPLKRHFKQHAA
jgi:hypothetical protein